MMKNKFFKYLKRKPKKKMVRICPSCNKKNLKLSSMLDGWLTPEVYLCLSCDYKGTLFLEIDSDEYIKCRDDDEK